MSSALFLQHTIKRASLCSHTWRWQTSAKEISDLVETGSFPILGMSCHRPWRYATQHFKKSKTWKPRTVQTLRPEWMRGIYFNLNTFSEEQTLRDLPFQPHEIGQIAYLIIYKPENKSFWILMRSFACLLHDDALTCSFVQIAWLIIQARLPLLGSIWSILGMSRAL